MKKFLSVILSIIIGCSVTAIGFTVTAAEKNEENSINSFISGITELAREYDADKNFEVVEENTAGSNVIMPFSTYADETSLTENEFSPLDFQTARLIVRANGNFNELGALEHINGFEDFHILQYESPEAAMKAYEQYEKEKNIISAAPDEVVSCLQGETSESVVADVSPPTDYLCDWSVDRTQSKRLQEYLKTADIPMEEVVVGIVDTGVDYNHEFLKDRIKRTYFNATADGAPNDEMDSERTHGTAVSSIIVDNTLSNIKIAGYKVSVTEAMLTEVCAAVLQATKDDVDVINMSLAFPDNSGLFEAVAQKAFAANIPIVCAVGNVPYIQYGYMPNSLEECISVSAIDKNNTIADWNTLTTITDVSAPGDELNIAVINNKYKMGKGTSFSSPCVAALVATLKSVHPNLSISQIEKKIKQSAIPIKNTVAYDSSFDGVGLIQFCDTLDVPRLEKAQASLASGVYDNEQECSLTCTNSVAEVYYTKDGTYPDKINGTLYTEPLKITDYTRIRAVAYYNDSENASSEIDLTYRIRYVGEEKDFQINENGIITNYTGNILDLRVPERINGVTVTGIKSGAFNNRELFGLTLPKSIKEISDLAFYNNQSLYFVEGEGILTIGDSAFKNASELRYVNFPNAVNIDAGAFMETHKFNYGNFRNIKTVHSDAFYYSSIKEFYGHEVETIFANAFWKCGHLEKVSLPKCKEIQSDFYDYGVFAETSMLLVVEAPNLKNVSWYGFDNSAIISIYFPSVESIEENTFINCANLKNVELPELKTIPKNGFAGNSIETRTYYFDNVKTIDQKAFGIVKTKRIEFSNLESAKDLPDTENCILAMPSTFTKCTENTKGRNYKVYGTKGTYAEKWANDNGHEFNEISQETALLQDVPMEYTSSDEPLTADVIGFNKTYQWYGNTVADNTTGRPIEGATGKDFNPADYDAYPYYYCVVTSTDVGYPSVTIRTGITANVNLIGNHDFSITQHNETKHWKECRICGLITTPENHYGGTATCTQAPICEICGATYDKPLGHTLGEWKTITPPTCMEKGHEKRSCADCDYEETRDITAVGHDLIHHESKIPTCTEIGWNEYDTCSRCDYSTYSEIPKLGHDYKSTVTPPTCTEKGFTTNTCSRCNDSYISDYTDALGHTNSEKVIENKVEPTCTTNGSHDEVVYCTVCNAELSRKNVIDEKLGHCFGEWAVTKEATKTEGGLKERICTICGVSETATIPIIPKEPTTESTAVPTEPPTKEPLPPANPNIPNTSGRIISVSVVAILTAAVIVSGSISTRKKEKIKR